MVSNDYNSLLVQAVEKVNEHLKTGGIPQEGFWVSTYLSELTKNPSEADFINNLLEQRKQISQEKEKESLRYLIATGHLKNFPDERRILFCLVASDILDRHLYEDLKASLASYNKTQPLFIQHPNSPSVRKDVA